MRTPTHHESVELEAMTLEQKLCKYWSQNTAAIGRGQLKPYGRQYLADLPISEDSHFRGFLLEGQSLYGAWEKEWFSPPSKRGKGFQPYAGTIVCHVKPTSDRFAGVPDRWDLFQLLRGGLEKFGTRTMHETILITRVPESWPAVERLMQWEANNSYRRTRLKKLYPNHSAHQLDVKYAESAMRGIDFEWPGKPNDRRKRWEKCVMALGLQVQRNKIPIPLGKPGNSRDRTIESQIARFLYEGVDRIQAGQDFHETLQQLGCTPSIVYNWLKSHRDTYSRQFIESSLGL